MEHELRWCCGSPQVCVRVSRCCAWEINHSHFALYNLSIHQPITITQNVPLPGRSIWCVPNYIMSLYFRALSQTPSFKLCCRYSAPGNRMWPYLKPRRDSHGGAVVSGASGGNRFHFSSSWGSREKLQRLLTCWHASLHYCQIDNTRADVFLRSLSLTHTLSAFSSRCVFVYYNKET